MDRPKQTGRTDDSRRADPERPERRGWEILLGRGLFETIIVAVGVFLALMVDEQRQQSEQRQLAEEARAALRTEILANREAVIDRLRTTARVYAQAVADPAKAARMVFERRNRPLLVNDAAWAMTVETGAIRWLKPTERTAYAQMYSGHDRMREVIANELIRWTELAAFPPESESAEDTRDRLRALRIWQGFAQRSQFALCMNLGRHEVALGAKMTWHDVTRFCVERPPTEDPEAIYREWRQRGWTSATVPQSIAGDAGR